MNLERAAINNVDYDVVNGFEKNPKKIRNAAEKQISENYRERALSGEYDPARDDKEMQYRLAEGVEVPFLRPVLPLRELLRIKKEKNLDICLVIPCKNEGTKPGEKKSNIGTTLDNLMPIRESGLVDRLWVISNSTDDTEKEVRKRNVDFNDADEMLALQDRKQKPGKGTNLHLASMKYMKSNQLLIFCDADFGAKPSQIQGVLSPLIEDNNTQMSLAWLERFTKAGDENSEHKPGGRATKFTFKPIMQTLYPELDGIQQPICGLYAGRGSALAECEFTNDYGIETALLTQMCDIYGKDSLAQTYCGVKRQTGQSNKKIVEMSTVIANEFIHRAYIAGRLPQQVNGRIEYRVEEAEGEKVIKKETIIYERDKMHAPSKINQQSRKEHPIVIGNEAEVNTTNIVYTAV